MRAKEFLREYKRSETIAKIYSFDQLDPYEYYRFGMDMGSGEELAGAPADAESLFVARTKAEEEKIEHAAKKHGLTYKVLSGDSKEHDTITTVSPVAKPKRNKYGI